MSVQLSTPHPPPPCANPAHLLIGHTDANDAGDLIQGRLPGDALGGSLHLVRLQPPLQLGDGGSLGSQLAEQQLQHRLMGEGWWRVGGGGHVGGQRHAPVKERLGA